MMRGIKLWLPLIALIGFGAIFVYGLARPKEDFVQSHMIGKKLPAFTLPVALPETPGLASADIGKGRPVLLNIFASWCTPCIAEAPQLETLKKQGVQIYGIALRDTPADLAKFLAENGNPYARIGGDQDMRVQLLLGSTGVPETYVIGSDGTILHQHIGDIRAEHVGELLSRLKAAQ